MYSYIMAVCLAIDIGGEPKNPCWMHPSDQIFRTFEACKQHADRKTAEMAAWAIQEHDVAAVVYAPCGEHNGS